MFNFKNKLLCNRIFFKGCEKRRWDWGKRCFFVVLGWVVFDYCKIIIVLRKILYFFCVIFSKFKDKIKFIIFEM